MSAASDGPVERSRAFERLPDAPMIEIVLKSHSPNAVVPGRWRPDAGGVIDVDGRPVAMHFAPRRWLVEASASLDVSDVVRAGAAVVDVDGCWARFALRGDRGRGTLAAATALDALLRSRRCAATTLFDCPAIVASVANAERPEWLVHVAASYVASFAAACERVAAHLE